jgi:tetratricopeptide (TPR) repeat protein
MRAMAWSSRLALLLPAVLFAALHLRALDYPFIWTDIGEIEYGTLIRPVDDLSRAFREPLHAALDPMAGQKPQSYYRPLQVTAVSLIAHHAGVRPRAFRVLNLALGVATALLFTVFALRLFGRVEPAVVAGSVFAAHPGNLEVYVWIAGMSAALADFFVVASVFAAAVAIQSRSRARRVLLAVASTACLLLALASKEHAVVTPALVMACALALGVAPKFARASRQSEPDRATIATAVALVTAQGVLVLAYLVWRAAVLGASFARAPFIGGSLESQVLSSLALWPRLLGWLLVPWQSTTSDVVRVVSSPVDPMVWLGLGLAGLSGVLGWIWLRRGSGVAALALAWIWIAFLPVAGVVPLMHARAERNLCLAVFGAALLWPAVAMLACGRIPSRLRSPPARVPLAGARCAAAALSVLFVVFLGARTWARTPDWSDPIRLFERDVARDPHYREGRYQLAITFHQQRRSPAAKSQLDALLSGAEAFEGRWSYLRMANVLELACHVNRGAGRLDDAATLVDAELVGRPRRAQTMPGFAYCGAQVLEEEGRVAEALDLYTKLLAEAPRGAEPPLHVGIARCHLRLGNLDSAGAALGRAEAGARDPALLAEIRRVGSRIRRAAAAP